MKAKKIYMILMCVILAAPVFASGFGTARPTRENNKMQSKMQQSTQNWTQNKTSARGGVIEGSDMDQFNQQQDPSVPVGDTAWVLMLGMGLVYGVYAFSKRKEEGL